MKGIVEPIKDKTQIKKIEEYLKKIASEIV